MLPSPSSSPPPPSVLHDFTNVPLAETPSRTKPFASFFGILTPPERGRIKRPSATLLENQKKRIKLSEPEESDDEESPPPSRLRRSLMQASYGNMRTSSAQPADTALALRSLVSCHTTDVFKCLSTDDSGFLTPPYACSYTHGSKDGRDKAILAVATEKGSVHLFDTRERSEWDAGPSCTPLQPHNNGVFDIKWNYDDTLLATCSGDQSTRITCVETSTTLHSLRGHTGTPKCISWNPNSPSLLSTGGRDGAVHVWDLRTATGSSEDGHMEMLSPVLSIRGVHEDTRRKKKSDPMRTVTSVIYSDLSDSTLISSGSGDGILRCWDTRFPTSGKKSIKAPLHSSEIDPTLRSGSKRPRGIISLTSGSGPTSSLLFAMSTDAHIYTYGTASLNPQNISYAHERLQTTSFYVGLSVSPCGRWLASGSTGKSGKSFLFDVRDSARPFASTTKGIELNNPGGEVTALDWADGMLATCVEDGMVRVWRPKMDIYQSCLEDPEAKKWKWNWAV